LLAPAEERASSPLGSRQPRPLLEKRLNGRAETRERHPAVDLPVLADHGGAPIRMVRGNRQAARIDNPDRGVTPHSRHASIF